MSQRFDANTLGSSVIIGVMVIAFALFNCFFTIDAGQRGVVLRFGAITDVKSEGIHFKVPFVDRVIRMEVRIKKAIITTTSSSKDLQEVRSEIALNYHLEPSEVGRLFKEIGLDWEGRIIDPAVRETMKAVAAQYTAEQLITKRDTVSNTIRDLLGGALKKYGLTVDEVSITDFSFSKEFDRAIESKQTAEQMALKAQRDLDRIKIEAEALRVQKQVVSKELIQLREIEVQKIAVEKWNGILPHVTGGATPFINVKSSK